MGGTEFPCSPAQERIWFLDRLEPGSPAYNVHTALRLVGDLDGAALRAAFRLVVARHAVLRTVFAERAGRPVQVVADEPAVDVREVAVNDRAAVGAAVEAEIRTAFDLAAGPLLRVLLLRTAPQDRTLVVTVHHSVIDGWSMSVLFAEVTAAYDALRAGRAPDLPALAMQYTDFAGWQRDLLDGPVGGEMLAQVVADLVGAPDRILLPTDRPRARRGAAGRIHEFEIPAALTAAAGRLADRHGSTVHMTLLAAYLAVLCRYSGQDDVVVGTVVGQRPIVEAEPLIGPFVNTVPVRARLADAPTFADLLDRVTEATIDALGVAELPFERVVEALAPARDLTSTPVYQVGFNGHVGYGRPRLAGLSVTDVPDVHTAAVKLDLMLGVLVEDGMVHGYLEYREDLFDASTIAGFARSLVGLLHAVVAEPGSPLAEVPLPVPPPPVPEAGGGSAPHPPVTVRAADLVAARARDHADAVAVTSSAADLTYGELDRAVDRMAHALLRTGTDPAAPVGLCVERGAATVVAPLAVWRAGRAYLPLDETWPARRIADVAADAGVRLVLAGPGSLPVLRAALPDHVRVVDAGDLGADDRDAGDWDIGGGPVGPPDVVVDPDDLAYLIYTSGSTGAPKAVAVPHRGVANVLLGLADRLAVTEHDVWAAITTPTFDMSVRELLLPLVRGATVAVLDTRDTDDPVRLAARLAAGGATILQTTPTRWRMLLASGGVPAGVRLRLCGGEALDRDLVTALAVPGAQVWNVYGPTEATMIVSAGRVEPGTDPVPLGPALPGTALHVLDPALRSVPAGVIGQLCIGGVGVSDGYPGAAGRTADRFLPDPLGAPGARIYTTGDLGRSRPDGTFEFLGRADDQVNVRGLRIEPAEIEVALRAVPGVDAAAVAAWPVRADDVRLVAYLVSADAAVWPRARSALAARLPAAMVPAVGVVLDVLPLTRTGKVDRGALPEPVWGELGATDRVAPRDVVERALAQLWVEVLAVDAVGVHDDFFALGGHSLLATRLTARVVEYFCADVPLRTLFEARTVAGYAQALRHLDREVVAVAELRAEIAALPADEVAAQLAHDDRTGVL